MKKSHRQRGPKINSNKKTGEITNLKFTGIEVTDTPRKIYTDQNGRLPVISSKGTKYVFVLYWYDANVIISENLKDRTGKTILRD